MDEQSIDGAGYGIGCREVGANAGENIAGGVATYNLFDIYRVMSEWPVSYRGGVRSRAYEIALNKVLSRILRDGPDAVVFRSERDMFAYARTVRSSAGKDAGRRRSVEDDYVRGLACGAHVSRSEATETESDIAYERSVLSEWLARRIGADDAVLLARVVVDGFTIAELAREYGVAESTLRSRFDRAHLAARAAIVREYGVRILAPRDAAELRRCDVVLYNDDVNEFSAVRFALVHHAELDPEIASICTMAAHFEGRAVVCRADRHRAERIVEDLRGCGLTARISRN